MQTSREFWKLASSMARRMRGGQSFMIHARRRWPAMSITRYRACLELMAGGWRHARSVREFPNLMDPLLRNSVSRPYAARMLRVIRGTETLRPWETPDLAFSDPRLSRFLPDPQARRAAA